MRAGTFHRRALMSARAAPGTFSLTGRREIEIEKDSMRVRERERESENEREREIL